MPRAGVRSSPPPTSAAAQKGGVQLVATQTVVKDAEATRCFENLVGRELTNEVSI